MPVQRRVQGGGFANAGPLDRLARPLDTLVMGPAADAVTTRHSTWTGALTVGALVAFASNSVLCRLALGTAAIDPATFTSVRLASGAALLWVVTAGRPASRPGGSWASAAALAAYAVAFSFAYVSLDIGAGALLLFGSVQTAMTVGALWRGERAQPLEWLGLAGAFAGLVYLVAPGVSAPPPGGAALMVAAGIAWSVYSLRGQRVTDPASATAANFVRAAPMALAVSAAAALAGSRAFMTPAGAGLALASGALASGLGYVVWYAALLRIGAIRGATVQLSVPLLAAGGGVLVLGEAITGRLLLSALLILGGVGLAVFASARRSGSHDALHTPSEPQTGSSGPAGTHH